ncbi:unnamed protein product [Fusarium graminearum]|uniref:Chromosome 3, complete genome n=1 Tax=Gibberella zeae (strain ATCC MYA-4620 / CBS 123657 / FGSC 9075 / NRRL 31084 / PH-1) TaxID=229533 RepID=A0A098E1S3_GIBZE|nr:unnamed protein product [Fusarium graminearum]CAG1980521.1 unnamed protein product [Fusarium graminearum]CAG1981630.1 unnamed protein product [Fusarium graminearum]CAG2008276.1 unnamed protein product [Fusarium graminearum]CEF88060.1 unnamed protein product [Fusarium graminearum]
MPILFRVKRRAGEVDNGVFGRWQSLGARLDPLIWRGFLGSWPGSWLGEAVRKDAIAKVRLAERTKTLGQTDI